MMTQHSCWRLCWLAAGFCVSLMTTIVVEGQTTAKADPLAAALRELPGQVLTPEQRKAQPEELWQYLRERRDQINRDDVAAWRGLKDRAAWEKFREERIESLRQSLGRMPDVPDQLPVKETKTIQGDGYQIRNILYESRPGFWVPGNLYLPAKPSGSMPGLLLVHSHHRPKVQGELQDMGMTWARQGCVVLVIDQVGHGERAAHPFQSEQSYKKDSDFRWYRQDYHFRYDSGTQLHLIGDSLMGWMVWDLMRGVDVLLKQPGIDPKRLVILGAVAGGGDPAAVTAALDRRFAAAVPFNFGGPQPETRFPLPDDADLAFNYLGGSSWESTRNLRRTGADGFLHWVIVGSLAPRGLIYAHEFAWDKDRDPVWKRLQTIYGWYDATDKLAYAHGSGSVKGRPPESTHCTNIGRVHRRMIHPAFQQWFDIQVTEKDEYSQPRDTQELMCWTPAARQELKPLGLVEKITQEGNSRLAAARQRLSGQTPAEQRQYLQAALEKVLGPVSVRGQPKVLSAHTDPATKDGPLAHVAVERLVLETEPGIVVPVLLLKPKSTGSQRLPVVVGVAQASNETFLKQRAGGIAELLQGGVAVCLPEVRGVTTGRGSYGDSGSLSFHYLLYDDTLLGARLRDLRAVLSYLRDRKDVDDRLIALWGDSFAPVNAADVHYEMPWRVGGRPPMSEPLGGLLALLGALYDDHIAAVSVHGGLSGFQPVLTTPYVYVPHDTVVPGILTVGDLCDITAALAPRPARLDNLVDHLNRPLDVKAARAAYEPTLASYRKVGAVTALSMGDTDTTPARWLVQQLRQRP
ncbi:MAG: hypothetical protein ACK4RK_07885 [Gemmataceae bacterium]